MNLHTLLLYLFFKIRHIKIRELLTLELDGEWLVEAHILQLMVELVVAILNTFKNVGVYRSVF